MFRTAIAAAWVWLALALPAYAYALDGRLPSDRADAFSWQSGREHVLEARPSARDNVLAARSAAREQVLSAPSAARDDVLSVPSAARVSLSAMCSEGAATHVSASRPSHMVDDLRPIEDDSPVAWCLTPDDPRCAPRDSSSLPDASRAFSPSYARDTARVEAARARAVQPLPRAAQLGAPRPGCWQRVERPPRA